MLLDAVVPRAPFVLRTFPPRAGETLAFCEGLPREGRFEVVVVADRGHFGLGFGWCFGFDE